MRNITARNLIRKNLKRLRMERGLTASTIAKLLNVKTNHIYRIERGESTLVPENMDLICKEYNIEHSYFLTDHETKNKTSENEIPIEIYNELLRIKDLSPEGRRSVMNFIRFQINEMENLKHADKIRREHKQYDSRKKHGNSKPTKWP